MRNEPVIDSSEIALGITHAALKRKFSAFVIQIDRLRAVLNGANTRYRGPRDHWSINEHLGHLIDVEESVWGPRIQMMMQVSKPFFEPIDQDALVRRHRWHEKSLMDLTAHLMRARWNNAVIVNGLSDEAFGLQGIHHARGEITLRDILELMLEEGQVGLESVRELLVESERLG